MKKIFLNGRFLTQSLTGVQRTAYELVKALDGLIEQGIVDGNQYTYELIYSGTIVTTIDLKNIRIVQKGILKGNLWEQIELPIYTFGKLLISMCTISCLFKRKQMLIVHDASFFVNPQFFSFGIRNWYKLAIPVLGKVACQLITVSEFSKQQLIKYAKIKSKKLEVISNAADHLLRFGPPDEEFKSRVESLRPFVLAVSSLSANKNFNVISAAMKHTAFSKHNVVIAGGRMKTLQDTSVNALVNYMGYVSDEQLKFLYQRASLFIFPSFYEGFGIPPIEAMFSGCPVLSSNTSSLPEILGDACEYFNPCDSIELSHKIASVIDNRQQMDLMREKGLSQAGKYSWERSAIALHKLALKTLKVGV